jgi:sugar phosphate isomerase/epimerase
MQQRTASRREVLKAAIGMVPATLGVVGSAGPAEVLTAQAAASERMKEAVSTPQLAIVSRHLQWTDLEEGAAVAAEAGFKAVAWTVRGGAHMEPEHIQRDLPRALAAAKNAGLAVPMLITSVNDATTLHAERVLDTMRVHGITRYRAPGYRYDYNGDLQRQWEALKPRIAGLAKLNEKYGTNAMFHTHSSPGSVGGGVWDLWLLVRDYPANVVGINYDIGHATVRGGTEWIETSHFAYRHVRALSLKDFHWVKRNNTPADAWPWAPQFVPPGQGMVNFRDIFTYFKSVRFSGPFEVYYEYRVDLGNGQSMNMLGTDYGKWKLEMPKAQFLSLLKRDVQFYRSLFTSLDWNVG